MRNNILRIVKSIICDKTGFFCETMAAQWGFMNAYEVTAGMAEAMKELIRVNYSTRPKFQPLEVKIFLAGIGDTNVHSMVSRGTKIVDAFFYNVEHANADYAGVFDTQIVAAAVQNLNVAQQLNALAMWHLILLTRGEMKADTTGLPAFVQRVMGAGFDTQADLARELTSVRDTLCFNPWRLVVRDIRGYDAPFRNRCVQGVAGHKAVKVAGPAAAILAGNNGVSQVLNAAQPLIDRNWRFLHPLSSNGGVTAVVPKFTHAFIAQICRDSPTSQAQILALGAVTNRDRDQINLLLNRTPVGTRLVTAVQMEEVVVRCFAFGEFLFDNATTPRTPAAGLFGRIQAVRDQAGIVGNDYYHAVLAAAPAAQPGAQQPGGQGGDNDDQLDD